jgi:hypothetical protein
MTGGVIAASASQRAIFQIHKHESFEYVGVWLLVPFVADITITRRRLPEQTQRAERSGFKSAAFQLRAGPPGPSGGVQRPKIVYGGR